MSKLKLSIAIGNYDRMRPLFDGAVQIDGVDPVFMTLPPEEIFFRAFRTDGLRHLRTVDVELHGQDRAGQLSLCRRAGVRVARCSATTRIYVRTDRIKTPADLKGKRVGLPEFQLTACVWARIILEDDHGVKPSDITWVRGGIDDPTPAGEDHHQAAAATCGW